MKEKDIQLKLISNTTGKPYYLKHCLNKFFERRAFNIETLEFQHMGTCPCWSSDYAVNIIASTEPSLWADSVDVKIEGIFPCHQTSNGKVTFGFPECRDESGELLFPIDTFVKIIFTKKESQRVFISDDIENINDIAENDIVINSEEAYNMEIFSTIQKIVEKVLLISTLYDIRTEQAN